MYKFKKKNIYSSFLKFKNNEQYTKKSKIFGLRSRSWYKIFQIHQKEKIFYKDIRILELGCFPGGWTQFILNSLGKSCKIFSCDVKKMKEIAGSKFIQGDCRTLRIQKILFQITKKKIDLVISDMSPKISGFPDIDMPKSVNLAKTAFKISQEVLVYYGSFLVKLFQNKLVEDYIKNLKKFFKNVKIIKPKASKKKSKEIYILAKYKLQ